MEKVNRLAITARYAETDMMGIIHHSVYPVWFEADDDDKDSTGKKGTGSSVKDQKGGKKKETQTLGARLAAKRRPSANKKSYWSKD